MKKLKLLFIVAVSFISLFKNSNSAFAESILANPGTTQFVCQYKSIKNGGDSVDATFYGQKPTSSIAGKVPRTCLDSVIAFGSNRKILATA